MRLIGTISNHEDAREFSYFLLKEGIKNQYDKPVDGDGPCQIWIHDEDDTDTALQWYEEFTENPKNPLFRGHHKEVIQKLTQLHEEQIKKTPSKLKVMSRYSNKPTPALGSLSLMLLITCILLFIAKSMSPSTFAETPSAPYPVIISSPLYENLFYDFPHSTEILVKLLNAYGLEALENPSLLPPEGQLLLSQQYDMQVWPGFYEILIDHFSNPEVGLSYHGPMFEKIQEGQVWRIFTPSLLHGDLFHLFFNMIWLMVLSPAIEKRVGKGRLLVLILLAAAISNTAQYLMSGTNFLGFSGIISAMIAFIWMRQIYFPWEGYPITKSTIAFIAFFIVAMVMLQLISFFMEINGHSAIAPGIANTAHITGALVGIILGRFNYFSVRQS